nr:unnamed protein product [Callosobruchus analis]
MTSFEQKAGFPNVIGAIDGTHIKIRKPKTDSESYINRKGFYSVNLQAVCNLQCIFTHFLQVFQEQCMMHAYLETPQ